MLSRTVFVTSNVVPFIEAGSPQSGAIIILKQRNYIHLKFTNNYTKTCSLKPIYVCNIFPFKYTSYRDGTGVFGIPHLYNILIYIV